MREELVMDDQIGTGHTAILWQMGRNVGLTDAEMDNVAPLPLVDVAFNVWANICRTRHWISGWLSTSTDEFILSTMPRKQFPARGLEKNFRSRRRKSLLLQLS